MNCNTRRHLYDVAAGGQRAVCLCGEGEPIVVPDAPDWAAAAADIVPLDAWTGRLNSHDLSITWRAEEHGALYDGSCEHWSIEDCAIKLDMGELTIEWDGDGGEMRRWMLALRRAAAAFG